MKKPNLREQFEKKTDLRDLDTEGKLWAYTTWLETINSEMIDALLNIHEAISYDYTEKYIFEQDVNDNSHLGKITITVKDARNIIKALKKAGAL